MQYVTTTSESNACSCDRSTLEQHASRVETVFADYLLATVQYPNLTLQLDPSQAPWWRVAHCCHTIYLRGDQLGPQLIESLADALGALRRRDQGGMRASSSPCRPHLTALPGGLGTLR